MATAADVAHVVEPVISHDFAWWGILVCFLGGLTAMAVADGKKKYLGIAIMSWVLLKLAMPGEYKDFATVMAFEVFTLLVFLWTMMTMIEGGIHYGMLNPVLKMINTKKRQMLLLIVGVKSFFSSSALDNMAAGIVMSSLTLQVTRNPKTQMLLFVVLISLANSGGVWSPVGNPGSVMLMVGGQLSITGMVSMLILPSMANAIVILMWFYPQMKGEIDRPIPDELDPSMIDQEETYDLSNRIRWFILFLVLAGISLVVAGKLAHVAEPWMSAPVAFGIFYGVTGFFINRPRGKRYVEAFGTRSALHHVDQATLLMFLLMLPLVAAAGAIGILDQLAVVIVNVANMLPFADNRWAIAIILGLVSIIVPNTPLVAATQTMFDYPTDDLFWLLLNYTTGVGGSLSLVGSAVGLFMASKFKGHLTFLSYMKVAFVPNFIAFWAGIAVFWVQVQVIG